MFLREPTHILLIVLVLILLFGAKRLPDSAKALGRSLRIFKGELKNTSKDDDTSEPKPETGNSQDSDNSKKSE
jgi:TatA/E family protein of Tat protein translocase